MNKIIDGAKQAVAFAKGEHPAARITIHGHTYVPLAVAQHESDCVEAAKTEIARLRAEIESKSKQIGKLYKVCNERDVLRNAMNEACDLLAERKYGNTARSPGHNARLTLESALNQQKADDSK